MRKLWGEIASWDDSNDCIRIVKSCVILKNLITIYEFFHCTHVSLVNISNLNFFQESSSYLKLYISLFMQMRILFQTNQKMTLEFFLVMWFQSYCESRSFVAKTVNFAVECLRWKLKWVTKKKQQFTSVKWIHHVFLIHFVEVPSSSFPIQFNEKGFKQTFDVIQIANSVWNQGFFVSLWCFTESNTVDLFHFRIMKAFYVPFDKIKNW